MSGLKPLSSFVGLTAEKNAAPGISFLFVISLMSGYSFHFIDGDMTELASGYIVNQGGSQEE